MPRKKKSEPKDKPEASDAKKLLLKIHERYKLMSEADDENRRLALADLKFVNEPGAQWDANMVTERGSRPCYEFNKLRINGKKVINEIRANRPQGKVRAVEGGDKEGAELREGLCRNIAAMSDLDSITDHAAEYVVDAGMGCWRVVTDYADDSMFDQDILIKSIKNPFCLYADPSCQDPLKRDAADWILTERIPVAAFESKYGKADQVQFEADEFDAADTWEDDETIRIAEYWYKVPAEREVWMIQGPQGPLVVDSTSDEGRALAAAGIKPSKRRTVQTHTIMMCVASGKAILKGPVEWAGHMFPFVMIYGEEKIIEGKHKWWGLHRFSKDAQRVYNFDRTAAAEAAHSASKSQWWVTADQAAGNVDSWRKAITENMPFMVYNPDPKSPGPPQRMAGAELPVAFLQLSIVDAEDIRGTSGLHEESLGEESNAKSGIAIARKEAKSQVVTYNFPDNMAKGMKRTWEILLDLIPEVYDAEREMRIIGRDGAEDYKKVNALVFDPATGTTKRINDLAAGKYDVTVTTGPSYSTQRQEAAEVWTEISSRDPRVLGVAGDLIVKSFDLPYAEEIGERFRTLLPPEIQKQLAEGKPIPPEAQAVMQQAQQAMMIVQQQTQLVQQAAQEVEQGKAEADKAKAEVQTAIENLKTEEARFEAQIAKAMAGLAQKEAQMATKAATQDQVAEREQLGTEVQQAIAMMQQAQAEFAQAVTATLADIMSKQQTQVIVPPQPRPTVIVAERIDGKLVARPIYETPTIQ
jgi:hypothetical protein